MAGDISKRHEVIRSAVSAGVALAGPISVIAVIFKGLATAAVLKYSAHHQNARTRVRQLHCPVKDRGWKDPFPDPDV